MRLLTAAVKDVAITTKDVASWFMNASSQQQSEMLQIMSDITQAANYDWTKQSFHIAKEFIVSDHEPPLNLEAVSHFLRKLLDELEGVNLDLDDIPPLDTAESGINGPPYGPRDYM